VVPRSSERFETLVIVSGGIDLSVGSVIKLSVLMSAILMNGKPENIAVRSQPRWRWARSSA
jgi:ribose/xylose/arabinose/galactoside ABC-type transport system permease subunit